MKQIFGSDQNNQVASSGNTDSSTSLKASLNNLRLINKHEAAAILGISPETLKKYRLQDDPPLLEGIHYHIWNSRVIRYNPVLLADWGVNRNNPVAHQRAIEEYLASLSCNRPKKRGRRAD